MSKKNILAFLIITVILLFTHQSVATTNTLKVYADGEWINYDVHPVNMGGRVLVPINYTSNFLDTTVHWDAEQEKATIYKKDKKVEFILGKKEMVVNGEKRSMDIAPELRQSSFFVPVRYLMEAFGYDVMWDSMIRSVVINTTDKFIYPQDEIIIPVLMYHHFDEKNYTNATIDPDEFREQMEFLKSQGYVTITNKDLILFAEGKMVLPRKPILITMDDGYESNYNFAYPVLKELNMKGTIYVIGSKVRETNDTPTELGITPKISWEQAREMYETGVMDIQNHTFAMHDQAENGLGNLDALIKAPVKINGELETEEEYEKRVREDLIKNKELIEEKVGNEVVGFAYPYGIFSEDSERLLKETGHYLTLTTKHGINKRKDGAYLLHRINVPPGTTGEKLVEMINEY